METTPPGGGGIDLLTRPSEGYGGGQINIVLDALGVLTRSPYCQQSEIEASGLINLKVDKIKSSKNKLLYVDSFFMNNILQAFQDNSSNRIWFVGEESETLADHFKSKNIKLEINVINSTLRNQEYLNMAVSNNIDHTEYLISVIDALEFNSGEPLILIGANLKHDAWKWSTECRPLTSAINIENSKIGITKDEALNVLRLIYNYK